MRKNMLTLCILAGLAHSAAAATNPEDRLKALEARIQALETEAAALRQEAAAAIAEAKAAKAQAKEVKAAQDEAAVAAVSAPAESSASAAGANGNAFNPAISVILNGLYSHHSLDPDGYERAGFPIVGEGGPSEQGLGLGESEVSLAANIDDKLYGQFTVSYGSENGETSTDIEEAFIDTTALPEGFNLRAGRFYSNIGYLNSHHTHTDNFADRPLAYQAFLGNQYGDDGVQLRWLAPTDLYLEFGGELFRGQNYPSGGSGHNGVGVKTLFVHAGGDVGDDNSWLAGLSLLDSKTPEAEDGFSGDNKLYVADLTWKWAPNGNTKDGGITFRSEYFLDDRDGEYLTDPNDPSQNPEWVGKRRGGYAEAVWRLNRTWDLGYRYDKLFADNKGPVASDFDPYRHTAELTWHNSEFSLIRLQYAHDRPNDEQTDNAVMLQYQVSLGAHGAHKF